MDEGLEAKLGAILSDPEQMEKISSLAMQLMGSGGQNAGEAAVETSPAPESSVNLSALGQLSEGGLGAMLGKLMGSGGKQSKSEALLLAMRPYLRPSRQDKLEKALRISRMLRLAGTAMKEYGGEFLGL